MTNKTKSIFSLQFPIYLISLLLIILTSCVLSPIYMQVGNDVVFMYTIVPIVLNYAILLFETMYLALVLACVSHSVYAINKGTAKTVPSIVYPLALVFIKHTLNLLVSSIIDSYIDVTFDLPVTIMLMGIDALIIALVWVVADRKFKRHCEREKKLLKASKYLDTVDIDESIAIYPFRGFFNFKNPVIIAIFTGAAIITASMLMQRVYADLFILGAPETVFEIGEIVLSYLFDILLGFAGYATSYFAASYIFTRS